MAAGARGPVHTADGEQVWSVLSGALEAIVAGESCPASAGETLLLAAGVERQILAVTDFVALVASGSGATVTTPDSPASRPLPWAA